MKRISLVLSLMVGCSAGVDDGVTEPVAATQQPLNAKASIDDLLLYHQYTLDLLSAAAHQTRIAEQTLQRLVVHDAFGELPPIGLEQHLATTSSQADGLWQQLESKESQLDTKIQQAWTAAINDPQTQQGSLIRLLEVSCIELTIRLRRELGTTLPAWFRTQTFQNSDDVIAHDSHTSYCLNAAHGDVDVAQAHLQDWLVGMLRLNENQARALDAAYTGAVIALRAKISSSSTISASRRNLLKRSLAQIAYNPLLSLFEVRKHRGNDSATWELLVELSSAIVQGSASQNYLTHAGLLFYDPIHGVVQHQSLCPGGALSNLPTYPSLSGGLQGASTLATPFGVPTATANSRNCGSSMNVAIEPGDCADLTGVVSVLSDPSAHGTGRCSLLQTLQHDGCQDGCEQGGGLPGGNLSPAGCFSEALGLGDSCYVDPLSYPIMPQPSASYSGGGGNVGPAAQGSSSAGIPLELPTGSLCGSVMDDEADDADPGTAPDDPKQAGKDKFNEAADDLRQAASDAGYQTSDATHTAAVNAANQAMDEHEVATINTQTPAQSGQPEGTVTLNDDGSYTVTTGESEEIYGFTRSDGSIVISDKLYDHPQVYADTLGHEGGHSYLHAIGGTNTNDGHPILKRAGLQNCPAGVESCNSESTCGAGQLSFGAHAGACPSFPKFEQGWHPLTPFASGDEALSEAASTTTVQSNQNMGACMGAPSIDSSCWAVDCAPPTAQPRGLASGGRAPGGPQRAGDTRTTSNPGNRGGVADCCHQRSSSGGAALNPEQMNSPIYGLWDPSPLMQSVLEHQSTARTPGSGTEIHSASTAFRGRR